MGFRIEYTCDLPDCGSTRGVVKYVGQRVSDDEGNADFELEAPQKKHIFFLCREHKIGRI